MMRNRGEYIIKTTASILFIPVSFIISSFIAIKLIYLFDFHYYKDNEIINSGDEIIIVEMSSEKDDENIFKIKFFADGSPTVSKYMAVYIRYLPEFIDILEKNNVNYTYNLSEKSREVLNLYHWGLMKKGVISYSIIGNEDNYKVIEVKHRIVGNTVVFRYKADNNTVHPIYKKTISSGKNVMLGLILGVFISGITYSVGKSIKRENDILRNTDNPYGSA